MAILTIHARRSEAPPSIVGARPLVAGTVERSCWSRACAVGEIMLWRSVRTQPLRGSLRGVPQNSQVLAVARESGAPQWGQWADESARPALLVAVEERER